MGVIRPAAQALTPVRGDAAAASFAPAVPQQGDGCAIALEEAASRSLDESVDMKDEKKSAVRH